MKEKIYTHDLAYNIVEVFEDTLDNFDVTLPSPEDDERDPENTARLYGTTYSDILDYVEGLLIESLDRAGAEYIAGEFSGNY